MAGRLTPESLGELLRGMMPEQRSEFIRQLAPGAADRVKQLLGDYATAQHQSGLVVQLLPHQRIPDPDEIDEGHLLAGGRGVGKTMAAANYVSRVAESVPGLRARVISPTLGDAVNGVALDPYSGILVQSPTATYKGSGIEGARIVWPNGSVCYLLGTPTHKDVDRLRALTNIDLDVFDEAAANARISEAVQQAALSRRGRALHHPIWIASTTPRPVPQYKKWLANPRVSVTRASTLDNPHTPETYREYAQSLEGTALYRQEILGEVLDDTPGALWTHADVTSSTITDPGEARAIIAAITRRVVGVDPPSGYGTCGIVVVGMTDEQRDPAGRSRVVILDDYSVSEATPGQWGSAVIDASVAYDAHIVAERNQGGLMVESTISQAARSRGMPIVPVTLATAMVSKERRAAPMALLWEVTPQRGLIVPPDGDTKRVALLVDQMTSWIPGTFSPDRLDAAAWATAYLAAGSGGEAGSLQPSGAKSGLRHRQSPSAGASFRAALMGRR